MSDIRFRCPFCQRKLTVDADGAGVEISCPKCSALITIPKDSTIPARSHTKPGVPGASPGDAAVLQRQLTQVRKSLEEQRELAQRERLRLEQELRQLVQRSEAEQGRLDKLLAQQKQETRALRLSRDQLEQRSTDENRAREEELRALRASAAEHTTGVEAVRKELAAAEAEVSVQRQHAIESSTERDQLRAELEDQVSRLEREQTDRKRREQQLVAERDQAKSSLETELAQRDEKIRAQEATMAADQQTFEREQSAMHDKYSALESRLQAEREELKRERKAADDEKSGLLSDLEQLRADLPEQVRQARTDEKEQSAKQLEALQKTVDDHREAVKRERREREVREQELESERVALVERLAQREIAVDRERTSCEESLAAQEAEFTRQLAAVKQEQEAEMTAEVEALRAALAGERELVEKVRQESAERVRELEQERNALQQRVEAVEAREAEARERVLGHVEKPPRAFENPPPKTIHALAEEARTSGLPLIAVQSPPPSTPASEAEPIRLHDPEPEPEEDSLESDSDSGEYLVPPVLEEGSTWAAKLATVGWFLLMVGVLALTLRVAWLDPAAYAIGLAFLFGLIAVANRRSPLAVGLILMSLVLPAFLLAGNRWGGFEGILAGPGAAAERPAIRTPSAVSTAPAPTRDAGPAEAPTALPGGTLPAVGIGESLKVDGVQVRLDAVHTGPIVINDILGKTIIPDEHYLIVDVTLENTHPDRPVFVKKAWEKARLVDDLDNSLYVIHQQRLGLDHIEGSLGSTELASGVPQPDRLVFEQPSAEADSFIIISDPGFYADSSGGFSRTISRESIRFRFTRDQIGAGPNAIAE